MVLFGQIVVGPPGSGKTTYCSGMSEFLSSLGRKVAIINLDPANESVPYVANVDVGNLVKLDEVMERLHLGPNGGLMYCMEFIENNIDWLLAEMKRLIGEKFQYVLIDCPGQVELYTHSNIVSNIIGKLEASVNRLCAVHLVESHHCSDAGKFISVCLTSLTTMMQLQLPHVNVLSKVDLIQKYGKLHFNIDYYTEVLDLKYLLDTLLDDPFLKKFRALNATLIDLLDRYSLVNFVPLCISNKEQMLFLKNYIDRANGYCFGTTEEERRIGSLLSTSMGNSVFEFEKTSDVREIYMKDDESF